MALGPNYVPAYAPQDQIEQLRIQRARDMAAALQAQSMQDIQPQQTGRFAVPISPFQGAAKILQAGLAGWGQGKADQRQMALADALRGRTRSAMAEIARGPQMNAPGGIVAPQNPGAVTQQPAPQFQETPQAGPGVSTRQQQLDALQGQEDQAFADLGAGKLNSSQFEGTMSGINDQRLIIPQPQAPDGITAPDVGITNQKPKTESAAEFAQRVRIIADRFQVDPFQIMQMPEIGGKYQQLLEMEKEGRGEARDARKEERQLERAKEQKRYELDLTAGQIKFHVTGPDGTTYGVTQAGQVVPLPSAGADMNKALIPDGKGGWKVNDQFVQAQGDIASRRSIQVNNYPNPIPVTDPKTGDTKMVQFGNKGETREVPYGPPEQTKPTDAERLGKGYHDRMQAAEAIMNKVGPAGYPTIGPTVASKIPGVGGYAERKAMSADQQKYRQAQEDWVRAKLRKESGAVIGKEEMDREISTYFPQIGDTPEVIQQKGEARAVAIQAMRDAAGPAIPKAKPPAQSALTPEEQKELEQLRKEFGK